MSCFNELLLLDINSAYRITGSALYCCGSHTTLVPRKREWHCLAPGQTAPREYRKLVQVTSGPGTGDRDFQKTRKRTYSSPTEIIIIIIYECQSMNEPTRRGVRRFQNFADSLTTTKLLLLSGGLGLIAVNLSCMCNYTEIYVMLQ